jgi:multidrug efflux system membrane fusion protein
MKQIIRVPALLLLVLLFLAGCAKEEKIVEEIRSIKTVTASILGTGRVLKFSGIVQAADSSALSFEVGGQVEKVNVDIGDQIEKGQVLAELDQEPYQLELKSAQAELRKAKANRTNKKADFEREEAIFKEGAGSKKRLDQARFGYDDARAGVQYAISKLNLAERDLRKTILYAPYSGSIGKREVDPHVEVRAGQQLFEIDAKGAKEVLVDIPETRISLLAVGARTAVALTTLPDETIAGRISYVGTVAGTANAFPVKVALDTVPPQIQSGMTAEVTFFLEDESGQSGFLIPVHAVVPGQEPNRGHLFIFDVANSVVKKTPAKISGVKDNMAIVSEGLSSGDIVAVAGVAFLSDGQKVRLMQQAEEARAEPFQLK